MSRAASRSSSPPKRSGILTRMVRQVVREFDPDRIILFGSRATRAFHRESDYDLLIVMPVETSKRQKSVEIGVALHRFQVSKDVFVVRPRDFAWRRNVPGTIEYEAWRRGQTVYARA